MMESVRRVKVQDKLLVVRVDLNSPIKNGKIVMNKRIEEHAKTINKIMNKGAKVVVLSHQGRKGKNDFRGLEEHAELLKEQNCDVKFVKDIVGKNAKKAINNLECGSAILLDNVRFLEDETEKRGIDGHKKSTIVKFLSNYMDMFVLDAFSVAHRDNASVVGFATIKPCVYGYVFEKEIEIAKMFWDEVEEPYIMIFGGKKIDDYIEILNRAILDKRVKRIVCTGILALILLKLNGIIFGEWFRSIENELGDVIKKLSNIVKSNKIYLPRDFAINCSGRKEVENTISGEILDIGSKTIEDICKILKNAKTVFIKGPAGKYEKVEFSKGTRAIFECVPSNAKCLLAGGNTIDSAKDFIEKKGFITSLSGGAMLKYISGKELIGIKALKISYEKFFKL